MYQENRQVPPAGQESYGKKMWHIWGPLVIKIGIAMLVSMAAGVVFMSLFLVKEYGITPEVMQDAERMQKIYEAIIKNSASFAMEFNKEYLRYSALIDGVAALVTIPVMLILFHRDQVKSRLCGIVQNKKAPFWKYAAAVIMSMAICLGFNNLILMGNFYKISEEYGEMLRAVYSAPAPVQIIALGILMPVCEELVFRGMIFRRLREKSRFLPAAIYSSLIYALFYVDMVQMIYGLCMGMVMAYIYEKYGSVKAPILAAVAANILSVAGSSYHLFDWMMADPAMMRVITVLCSTVASTMFVWIQRIEENPQEELAE